VNPNSGERNTVTIPDLCLEEVRAVTIISQFELRLEELHERAGEVTLILSAGRIVVVVGLGRRKSAEEGSKRLVDEDVVGRDLCVFECLSCGFQQPSPEDVPISPSTESVLAKSWLLTGH
jgi:hypothetical protein